MTYRQGFDRLGNPVAKPKPKRKLSRLAHHVIQSISLMACIIFIMMLAAK